MSFFDKIIPSSPKKTKAIESPISSLTDLHILATTLSYLGYRDEIERLFMNLSKTARRFVENAQDLFEKYLPVWQPEVSGLIEFGRGSCYNLYPSKKYL